MVPLKNRPLRRIDLGGDKRMFVRALCVDSVYFRDNDDEYCTKKHHVLLVTWFLSGYQRGSPKAASIEFVTGLDLTKRYLLLEETILVSIPRGSQLEAVIVLGPYVSVNPKEYMMLQSVDESVETAALVPECFRVQPILSYLCSPSSLPNGVAGETGRLVCFLGGPGIGKSTAEAVELLRFCARHNYPVLVLSALNSVRNNQIQALHYILGEAIFDLRVRCEGQRNLSPLSLSRTADALVWDKVKVDVTKYEKKVADLERVMLIMDVLLLQFPCNVRRLIDTYGAFSQDLCNRHRAVAFARCDVEGEVIRTREDILKEKTIVVGTYGAIEQQVALSDLKKMLGSRSLKLIENDEISRTFFFDFTRFMAKVTFAVDHDTWFVLKGDPSQTSTDNSLLSTTQTALQQHSVNASIMDWLLESLQKIPPEVLLRSGMDYVNTC